MTSVLLLCHHGWQNELLEYISFKSLPILTPTGDTQHNDTQHNDTQHNDTQHNDTQHNDTQHMSSGLYYKHILTIVSDDRK
jgi:hypothetical protein